MSKYLFDRDETRWLGWHGEWVGAIINGAEFLALVLWQPQTNNATTTVFGPRKFMRFRDEHSFCLFADVHIAHCTKGTREAPHAL